MRLSVVINSHSFAHKILGNRNFNELYVQQNISLDGLKSECLDAFGLFDASLSELEDQSPEKAIQLKNLFELQIQLPNGQFQRLSDATDTLLISDGALIYLNEVRRGSDIFRDQIQSAQGQNLFEQHLIKIHKFAPQQTQPKPQKLDQEMDESNHNRLSEQSLTQDNQSILPAPKLTKSFSQPSSPLRSVNCQMDDETKSQSFTVEKTKRQIKLTNYYKRLVFIKDARLSFKKEYFKIKANSLIANLAGKIKVIPKNQIIQLKSQGSSQILFCKTKQYV